MSPHAHELKHVFADIVPEKIEDATLYISMKYATVVHLCCCGCRKEVVTPLTPTDWKLIFDGTTISLEPSIGNWNFTCQSHYWITRNRVRWARPWTQREVNAGRSRDRQRKDRYFSQSDRNDSRTQKSTEKAVALKDPVHDTFWAKLRAWWANGGH